MQNKNHLLSYLWLRCLPVTTNFYCKWQVSVYLHETASWTTSATLTLLKLLLGLAIQFSACMIVAHQMHKRMLYKITPSDIWGDGQRLFKRGAIMANVQNSNIEKQVPKKDILGSLFNVSPTVHCTVYLSLGTLQHTHNSIFPSKCNWKKRGHKGPHTELWHAPNNLKFKKKQNNLENNDKFRQVGCR